MHSRDLATALLKLRSDLSLINYDRWESNESLFQFAAANMPNVRDGVSLSVTGAPEFAFFAGKRRIGWTVWETTRLPPMWLPMINQLDELWMSTKFGMQLCRDSGVQVPTYLVHQGVQDYFNPYAQPFKELQNGRFKFLFVGKWEKRKGCDVLVQAFSEEFAADEPVDLMLNAYNQFVVSPQDWNFYRTQQLSANGVPPKNSINWIDRVPKREDMARLYCSCDAFVIPTRGEGWCAPDRGDGLADAVIATNHSGQTEFFDDSVGYLLKNLKLEPAFEEPFIAPFEEEHLGDAGQGGAEGAAPVRLRAPEGGEGEGTEGVRACSGELLLGQGGAAGQRALRGDGGMIPDIILDRIDHECQLWGYCDPEEELWI